jgi:Lrp/AsnC family leucine-responsive transcriptional regulator
LAKARILIKSAGAVRSQAENDKGGRTTFRRKVTALFAVFLRFGHSAIQRRLRRMREEGVIVRHAAVVDSGKVGRPTFFVVSVQVERERLELLAQLRTWLAAQKHIQQAFYVTGESDFVLIVTAPDTETYDALMTHMVRENPNVKRFTTNVVLSVVKTGLTIPILPVAGE